MTWRIRPGDEGLALPRSIKAKKGTRVKRDFSLFSPSDLATKEDAIQGMAEQFCMTIGLDFDRIPDGILADIQRTGSSACKRFVTKYWLGQPDLLLLHPKGIYLWLEIKTAKRYYEKDAGLSQGQRNWWRRRGLKPLVTFGEEETIQRIQEFWEEPETNERV